MLKIDVPGEKSYATLFTSNRGIPLIKPHWISGDIRQQSRLLAIGLTPVAAERIARLARQLVDVEVTLAVPTELEKALSLRGIRLLPYETEGEVLRSAVAEHDVILVHSTALHNFPFLAQTGRPLVVDLAIHFLPERLETNPPPPSALEASVFSEELRILNELLRTGDFFLCASEAKRGFWLGMLFANHRVNPHTLARGGDLRSLLAVVPELSDQDEEQAGPLATFCANPQHAPDQGLYVTDLERVAKDRGEVIEGLLEFNYWYGSSIDRGGAIEYLESEVRNLKAELEQYRLRK